MLKNTDVLLKALYTQPKLFSQVASSDRQAAFSAIHAIVPSWSMEDFEQFYDEYMPKYFALILVIEAAVRDSEIKEKIFSANRTLAYETALSIADGYTYEDFDLFMKEYADLVFQCFACELMATGTTPLSDCELSSVMGGITPLQIPGLPGKIFKPLISPPKPTTKTQIMQGIHGEAPGLVEKLIHLLGKIHYHCFAAGSLVSTPQGSKPIEQIRVGDEVFGADTAGNIVRCRVTEVRLPAEEAILTVEFSNGAIWDTTASQWFYTGTTFYSLLNIQGHSALTDRGGQAAIRKVTQTERRETVYDFVVDGQNVMFINGIAAEGYSEE